MPSSSSSILPSTSSWTRTARAAASWHGISRRDRATAVAPTSRGAGDRGLRPRLFLGDLGTYLHRRRQRDDFARRVAAAGYGIRSVPPDRHLWRRAPDHRG